MRFEEDAQYPIRGIMCWDKTIFTDNDEKLTDFHTSLLESERLDIFGTYYSDCTLFKIRGDRVKGYSYWVAGFEIRFIESYKEGLVPNYVNGDTFDKAVNHCKTKGRRYWL